LLADKPIFSAASGNSKLHHSINRVWSGNNRFRRPANRVSRSRPGRACASICWLANRLPASRTAIASSAVPSIGYSAACKKKVSVFYQSGIALRRSACKASTSCASMYWLANRFSAARAGTTGSTVPSIG